MPAKNVVSYSRLRITDLENCPDASYHSLRHAFVTSAISRGVPAPIVRALVGHATAAMTDRYSHISAETMCKALKTAGLE